MRDFLWLYTFLYHHHQKNKIPILLTALSIIALVPAFAQEPGQDTARNRGYIASKDIADAKKGTVIYTEEEGRYTDIDKDKKNLSVLEEQARDYRGQGLELQNIGNLDDALKFYQKSAELDPAYAVVYNDMGIIYEAKGDLKSAEDCYLMSIKIEPNFLSVYSNLALLYEGRRDLEKAFFYWKKRVGLGLSDDPWTQKAKKRMDDLIQVMPSLRQAFLEQEAAELSLEVAQKAKLKKEEDLKKAKEYYESAKRSYHKVEYKKAIDELNLSLTLNPQDKDALSLLDTAKNKLTQQEKIAKAKLIQQQKNANIQKMQADFQRAIKYYQQDNPSQAKEEINKITKQLSAAPQKN